jgi:hypothetical protein
VLCSAGLVEKINQNFVASSWSLSYIISMVHGHTKIKSDCLDFHIFSSDYDLRGSEIVALCKGKYSYIIKKCLS